MRLLDLNAERAEAKQLRGHSPAVTLTGGCRSGCDAGARSPARCRGKNLMMASSIADGQPDYYDCQSYDNR